MDEISFYRDCDAVLKKLINDKVIDFSDIKQISPNNSHAILQEFKDNALIKNESILLEYYRVTSQAYVFYNRKHYERIVDRLVLDKKRDDLVERGTISAEKSAESAKMSAVSAKEAISISKEANKHSFIANCIAILAIIVSAIVAYLVSRFR